MNFAYNRLTWFLLALLLGACGCREIQETDPVKLVNPFIGTGGHGHTFPGPALPFGMVQLSPDTRLEGWDGCSGYHASDSVIYGFSHTHLSGTGVSDYGDILLMPRIGKTVFGNGADSVEAGYASRFVRDSQIAHAGYYKVVLSDYNIEVELTATARAGMHRYTFPNDQAAKVVLDLDHRDQLLEHDLKVVGTQRIEGYRISKAWAEDQRIYFIAEFSEAFREVKGNTGMDSASVIELNFGELTAPLIVRVGISATSIEAAAANLAAEVIDFDFDRVQKAAEEEWRTYLNRIKATSTDSEELQVFYTALYHTAIAPNLFSDVDGSYRGTDGEIHQVEANDTQYTIFSLWDTYRTTHPLYTLIAAEDNQAFIRSMLRQYEDGGRLPIWELAGNYTGCMIGYHAIPVIADAYLKGQREFRTDLALKAMVHSAEMDWLGIDDYRRQGYIAVEDEPESVSKTLEYAFDDWCIAKMAEEMGRPEVAERFRDRAYHSLNLFDPETGFFRARQNGGWQQPFNPYEVNFNYTEANAWQYSTYFPHDITLLNQLHGGRLSNHLDNLFTAQEQTAGREQADITGLIGQYAHGNEPSHHVPYLYSMLGQPQRTTDLVRQIMDDFYSNTPDGLIGNEDCGQMSAWYVFSAMGFYPVTPGSGEYVLGAPRFARMEIDLNGKVLIIKAENFSSDMPYVQSVHLNGRKLTSPYIKHTDLAAGGELVFTMGEKFGAWFEVVENESKKESPVLLAPVIESPSHVFEDSMLVRIDRPAGAEKMKVLFSENAGDTVRVEALGTFYRMVKRDVWMRAYGLGNAGMPGFAAEARFIQVDSSRQITVQYPYSEQYTGGGERGLLDGLRGGADFRTGRWQGYRDDFVANVDLGKIQQLEEVRIGFLQDIRSWIWMPKEVLVEASEDGLHWQEVRRGGLEVPADEWRVVTRDFVAPIGRQVRYLRVRATQFGVCPDWHMGAGGKTWIFVDEIAF